MSKLGQLFTIVLTILSISTPNQSSYAQHDPHHNIGIILYFDYGNYASPSLNYQPQDFAQNIAQQQAQMQQILNNAVHQVTRDLFKNFSANPNLENLKNYAAQLANESSPEIIAHRKLVQGTIRRIEYFNKLTDGNGQFKPISQIVGQETHLKERFNETILKANPGAQIPNVKIPHGSVVGQKLYPLMQESIIAGDQSKVEQLQIAAVLEKSGNSDAAVALIGQAAHAMNHPEASVIGLPTAARFYFSQELEARKDFQSLVDELYDDHKDELSAGDLKFLSTPELKSRLEKLSQEHFFSELGEEAKAELRFSLEHSLKRMHLSETFKHKTKELGFSSLNRARVGNLYKTEITPGLSGTKTVSMALSQGRAAVTGLKQELTKNPSLSLNSEQTFKLLDLADDTYDQGEKFLGEGYFEKASLFTDAARVITTGALLDITRIGLGFVPIVGDAIDLAEAISGVDTLTGEPLTGFQRILALAGVVIGSRLAWEAVLKVGGPVSKDIAKGALELTDDIIGGKDAFKGLSPSQLDDLVDAKLLNAHLEPASLDTAKSFFREMKPLSLEKKKSLFKSFDYSNIKKEVLEEDLLVYRWHDGSSMGRLGRFTTEQKVVDPLVARRIHAIPEGNSMSVLESFKVKKGTTVFKGAVRRYDGGAPIGSQVFIVTPSKSLTEVLTPVEVIKK